jgi:DNA-binding transcriptional ArsR family regulator
MDEHGGRAVPVDQLTRTFAALADPTRRAILARLAEGEATVGDLAEPFPISVQAVSKHLKVLEGAGLITRGRTAQLRPSRLHGAPLKEAADWLEAYRAFWEGSFDRLEARLRTGDPPGGGPGERRAGGTATERLGADA